MCILLPVLSEQDMDLQMIKTKDFLGGLKRILKLTEFAQNKNINIVWMVSQSGQIQLLIQNGDD